MAKAKKPKRRQITSKGKKQRGISGSQSRQPFEQDSKRRIGQYGGAGEPPIMK